MLSEKVAAKFGDDGTVWEADGVTLDEYATELGAEKVHLKGGINDDGLRVSDRTLYKFPDDSIIIATPEWWDVYSG